MKKRKICIITGTRAEWGLFRPLASEIKKNKKDFILQIVATSSHLSSKFGFTYKEIRKDGFLIDRKANILLSDDTEIAVIGYVSVGIKKISQSLQELKPDLVFLLGDRFETLAAATACLFLKIPVAHLHGGELTEGSLDDTLRHAITKMSYIHFVSNKVYRKRVIQMGENPARVFVVGALGIDNILNMKVISRKQLEKKIKFTLGKKNIMVTFHPATFDNKENIIKTFRNLLKAIDKIPDVKIIFTKPGVDMCSSVIHKLIDNYVHKNNKKSIVFKSMGARLYLNALRYMDVVVGNSSSGIIEAPSFGIPSVNVGDRQKGRIMPKSVINANNNFLSIKNVLKKAFDNKFREKCQYTKNPYGSGNTARNIVSIIKKTDFSKPNKSFFDL